MAGGWLSHEIFSLGNYKVIATTNHTMVLPQLEINYKFRQPFFNIGNQFEMYLEDIDY